MMHPKTLVPALLGLLPSQLPPMRVVPAETPAPHYRSIDRIRDVDGLINIDELQYATPTATPTELSCLDKCAGWDGCAKQCAPPKGTR